MTRISLRGAASRALEVLPRIQEQIVFGATLEELTGATPASAVYVRGTRDDIPRALAISGETGGEIAHAVRRFDAGDQLVYARIGEEIVFYGWVTVGAMEAGRRLVPTHPSVAYAYKLFASRKHRGLGLARGFYGTLHDHLPSSILRVIACVAPRNTASMRLHEAVGFRPVGDTRIFCVGNWAWGTVGDDALAYAAASGVARRD